MKNIKNKMCLIGKNILHSQSPKLYNKYFNSHKLNWKYYLQEIDDLSNFIYNLNNYNYKAFNVTMPYKKEITKYLDYSDEYVTNAKSANLVIRKNNKLYGFNTDGIGFYKALLAKNIVFTNKTLTIIGNGGAGNAIIKSAFPYKFKKINIITHNLSNYLFFYNTYNFPNTTYSNLIYELNNTNILVNTSNVGFGNDMRMPLPKNILDEIINNKNLSYFIDIIYNPIETQIIKYFKEHSNIKTMNGEAMLHYQFIENINILEKYLFK